MPALAPRRDRAPSPGWMLLAAALAAAVSSPALGAPAAPPRLAPAGAASSAWRPDRFAGRADKYYRLVWGVDSLTVRLAESGEVVRFSYRVVDPARARSLSDRANEPSLLDPRAGVALAVPAMEKIGPLRQTGAAEAGKAYWMAFSNKGRPVKRGDRVDVVIGPFRAHGLVVD